MNAPKVPKPLKMKAVADDEGKMGKRFRLTRGDRVVGELRRSLSGTWVGFKWKNPNALARAQKPKVLLRKMEDHV